MTDSWQDPWTITEVPVLPAGTTLLKLVDTKVTVLDGATLPQSITHIIVTSSPLRTVRNLHLLPNLAYLDLSWSVWLDTLDTEFPPSLWSLTLNHCTYIRSLPKLSHTRLSSLNLYACSTLTRVPALPDTLRSLGLERCDAIHEMPYLPDSLDWLYPSVRFVRDGPPRTGTFMDTDYARKWRDHQRRSLRKQRYEFLHESLMAAAWHPDRVGKWLESGEGVLDMMMGC